MAGANHVHLIISGLTGHLCTVTAESTWLVHELKVVIESAIQISRWQQRLFCHTSELLDRESLSSLPTTAAAELTLVRRPPDQASWLRMAQTDWSSLLGAPSAAWADREVVLAAVEQCGWALQHAVEELQSDRDVVFQAVRQNGLTLQCASQELARDPAVALAAVAQCGRALEFVAPELQSDRGFLMEAVRQNGRVLKHAAAEFRADRELALAAVQQCGGALAGAAKSLRADYELVAEAVTRDGSALAFAAAALRADRELGELAGRGRCRRQKSGSFCGALEANEEAVDPRTFSFGNGRSEGNVGLRRLLGDKGAHLCEMAKLGLPVPAGFCVMAPQGLSEELRSMVKGRLREVEQATGQHFGDVINPLLLSVWGAVEKSGPGGPILVGLNDSISEAWVAREGSSARFVWDTYRRLIAAYARHVKQLDMKPFEERLQDTLRQLDAKCQLGRRHHDSEIPTREMEELVASYKVLYKQHAGEIFPQDPEAQLEAALAAAFSHSLRPMGTATVQATVFGNSDGLSAAGTLSMRDGTSTDLIGEWLVQAQGGDMASGLRTPRKLMTKSSQEWAQGQGISEQERVMSFPSLEEEMPTVYAELVHCQDVLHSHFEDPLDVEFSVQHGKLWLVQGGPASPELCEDTPSECTETVCPSTSQSTLLSTDSTEMLCTLASRSTLPSWDAGAGVCAVAEEQAHSVFTATDVWTDATGPAHQPALNPPGTMALPSKANTASGVLGISSNLHLPMRAAARAVKAANAISTISVWHQLCKAACSPHVNGLSSVSGGQRHFSSTQLPADASSVAPKSAYPWIFALPLWQTVLAGGLAGFASRWAANAAELCTRGRGAHLAGCMRSLPTGAICCTCYVNLLSLVSQDGTPDGAPPLPRLACATTAATLAGTLTHPIDALRPPLTKATSRLSTVLTSIARSGTSGLFRGLGPSLARSVPTLSLELCTIDLVKSAGVDFGWAVSPGLLFVAGGLAGALSQTCAYPLNEACRLSGDVPRALPSKLFAQGLDPILKGIGTGCIRSVPGVGVNSLVRVGMLTRFMQHSD